MARSPNSKFRFKFQPGEPNKSNTGASRTWPSFFKTATVGPLPLKPVPNFTVDAVIGLGITQDFTADARITSGPFFQSGSFTADATVARGQTGSFTADAIIQKTFVGTRITFIDQNNAQSTGGLTGVTFPAGTQPGDFILCYLRRPPGVTASVTETGYTQLTTFNNGDIFGQIWIHVVNGTEDGTIGTSFSSTGGTRAIIAQAWRGVSPVTPYESVTNYTDGAADPVILDADVTTLGFNRLALNLIALSTGASTSLGDFTGETGGDWTLVVGTHIGSGATPVYRWATNSAQMPEAGTIGGGSQNSGGSPTQATFGVALIGDAIPLTVDAFIAVVNTATFTANAVISSEQTASFTANAVISASQTASATADAVLSASQTASATADAVVQATRTTSFTADAEIQVNQGSASLTADAVISISVSASVTADAIVQATQTASATADAVLSALRTSSATADSVLAASVSASFAADAVLSASITSTFTADAFLLASGTAFLTADAVISISNSSTFTANAIISVLQTGSLSANAVLQANPSSSLSADAVIQRSQTATFPADSIISTSQTSSFTGDAFIATLNSASFTGDAVVAATVSSSFTADAVIPGAGTNFTADAVIVTTSRFYLSATLAPPVSPSFESGWESTGSAQRRMMGRPSLVSSTKANLGVSETSTSGTFDVLIYQFVSEPTGIGGTITGFTGLIRATEDNAAADMRSQSVLKVVSGDGTTLRGVVTDFNAGALSSEWPTTSSSQRYPFAASTSTPVTFLPGDRIVVEAGYRSHNTSATSRTGTLRSGHAIAGADFTTTGTTTDLNPWFDITATVNLAPTETSITVNAVKAKLQTSSISANAVIAEIFRSRHSRTGPQHSGVDLETVHTIAWSFDRYLRGQNFREWLIDMDARLTAMESGFAISRFQRIYADAVIRAAVSSSFTASANIQNPPMTFTANAFIQPFFSADAWLRDPAFYIDDNVLTAPTWTLSSRHNVAVINTSALTWDPTNDPDWWYGAGESYLTGWAKFTLGAPANVHIDSINSQGDSVIELWTGSPPSWPSEPYAFGDDDEDDPTNPYGISPVIDTTTGQGTLPGTFDPLPVAPLPAGTYYVLVHSFAQAPSPHFNITLRMYLP